VVRRPPGLHARTSERARQRGQRFGVEPHCRFAGEPLKHHTFFLIDPGGNRLEFKHYRDPETVLGRQDAPRVGNDELR